MDMTCDLVLEGGGVKGLGLVGALTALAEHGYKIRRVAGTSAGAIVGSLVAAGMSPADMKITMQQMDYTKFRDKTALDHLGVLGKGAQLLISGGVYHGNYALHWLERELEKLGIRTFADLAITEPWAEKLPPEQRYRLVVVVSDITRGRMVRLPWDYKEYGLDPNTQRVAHAVRASMSIPLFYKPVRLGRNVLVDGGLLSNFPIDSFDNTPNWPTYGIKLSTKTELKPNVDPTHGVIDLGKALMATATNAHDWAHLDDPAIVARTIFVDTTGISATDFGINRARQEQLFANGQKSATKFLETLPNLVPHLPRYNRP